MALGVEAVAHGANVYFITIPDLLDQLARDVQENRLSEHLRSLRHPTLLILDEMGYLPLDQVATSFLFQLVSKRYTKGSIIVTSNKSYAEWGSVFGDEVAAAAVIDRLLHFSSTVNIRGESYRLKDKKRAGAWPLPLRQPSRSAPDGKEHRQHVDRKANRRVNDARVEVAAV